MADENPKPMALTGTIKVPIDVPNHKKEYLVQISPPGPMVPLDELERALEHNRDQLRTAEEDIKKTVRTEIVDQPMPFLLNYDSPTQLAIMAHLNINVLIPIINLRGGKATYNKFETMNVKDHVERLHNMAQKNVLENLGKENKPFQMAMLAAILLAVIIVFMLSTDTG